MRVGGRQGQGSAAARGPAPPRRGWPRGRNQREIAEAELGRSGEEEKTRRASQPWRGNLRWRKAASARGRLLSPLASRKASRKAPRGRPPPRGRPLASRKAPRFAEGPSPRGSRLAEVALRKSPRGRPLARPPSPDGRLPSPRGSPPPGPLTFEERVEGAEDRRLQRALKGREEEIAGVGRRRNWQAEELGEGTGDRGRRRRTGWRRAVG
jgi:hypothetical protein